MTDQIPPENLIKKYARGRMPPLVDMDCPSQGLISPETLKIYRAGFNATHFAPFDILFPGPADSLPQKWLEGEFLPGDGCNCTAPSVRTEGNTPDKVWDVSDRRHAILVDEEEEKIAVAYVCAQGRINFAVPVVVDNQVIAMLFCGRFKPKPGSLWNPRILEPNGYFEPLKPGEMGIVLKEVTGEEEICIAQCSVEKKRVCLGLTEEISSQRVEEFLGMLKTCVKNLSDLATFAYESEKTKVLDWIEKQFASTLLPLSSQPENVDAIWKDISEKLTSVAKYFGFDYVLILSLHDTTEKKLRILCQTGLPENQFQTGTKMPLTLEAYRTTKTIFNRVSNLTHLKVNEFERLPVLENLYGLYATKGKSAHVLAMPVSLHGKAAEHFIIAGKLRKDITSEWHLQKDLVTLRQVVDGISHDIQIILLVEQLEISAQNQAHFLENVAHDIRTPIQNMIVQSDAFSLIATVDDAKSLGQKIAAQARRLNRMSARIWTMVNIDRGAASKKPEWMPVYQTIMEHRKFLLDVADKKEIQITVDKAIENWQAVQLHRDLFSQAVLNLIDNAIKYSRPKTEIRIDGKRLTDGVALNFANRGIAVREKDKERIFERYYRTPEARILTTAGTGIGLYIVKAFIDQAGGSIEVTSEPIEGTKDYLTIFKMTIPTWR